MLRSPKEKFIASSHKAAFEKIVQSDAFEEAILAALLQMENEMPRDCTPNQAADAHNQMAGARKYLETLCSIHQPEKQLQERPFRELNYKAGV